MFTKERKEICLLKKEKFPKERKENMFTKERKEICSLKKEKKYVH